MKKSRLVPGLFSVLLLTSIAHAFSPGRISLSGNPSEIDFHRLEKALLEKSRQRGETGKYVYIDFNGAQSFMMMLGSSNKYYIASSKVAFISKKSIDDFGRGYCQFDLFDNDYQYVDGVRVHIKDAEATNVCNYIYGVSAVTYRNQPGLLVVVQYHDGLPQGTAKTIDEIGNGYHRFTTLLVLDPHPDGSVSMRQDDSCLGAMNQIDTLSVARKRLAECSQ